MAVMEMSTTGKNESRVLHITLTNGTIIRVRARTACYPGADMEYTVHIGEECVHDD